MKVHLLLSVALVTTLYCGCRQNPHMQVYIDNINAEKRVLEDKLYDLQFDYEAKQEELERLQKKLQAPPAGQASPRRPAPPRSLLRPNPPAESTGPLELGPPDVDLGPSSGTSPDPADQPPAPPAEKPKPFQLDLGTEPDPAARDTAVPVPADQDVTQLYLDPVRTGAVADQQADAPTRAPVTKAGLRIMLQPRNQAGQYVPVAGQVSAVLLDPVQRTRVFRWDWQVPDVQAALQAPGAAEGIELCAPWGTEPPSADRLHLFVRFTPNQGSTLEADREIALVPSDDRVATRWTPRSPTTSTGVAVDAGENAPHPPPPLTGDRAEVGGQPSTADGTPRQAQRPQWRPYR